MAALSIFLAPFIGVERRNHNFTGVCADFTLKFFPACCSLLALIEIEGVKPVKETKKLMNNNEEDKTQTDLEWEQRTLCSDESCIGVIGPDGRCKECGLPYAGPFDPTKKESTASNLEAADPDEDASEELEDSEEYDAEPRTDLEWEQRTLCSDESCIGVIGPDGRCKECGKPYEGES
jgi:hypothetical protein